MSSIAVGDDEVSRQREKRTTALLARLVPGFPGLTFGQTVAGVVLAAEQAAGVLDVERFLADQGHDRRTIESVLAYLGPEAARHGVTQNGQALDTLTGTATVVEFPLRRKSGIHDATSGCEPAGPAHTATQGMLRESAAVTTDGGATSDDVGRHPSVIVGASGTKEKVLTPARRLQVLRRLQAMLLPE